MMFKDNRKIKKFLKGFVIVLLLCVISYSVGYYQIYGKANIQVKEFTGTFSIGSSVVNPKYISISYETGHGEAHYYNYWAWDASKETIIAQGWCDKSNNNYATLRKDDAKGAVIGTIVYLYDSSYYLIWKGEKPIKLTKLDNVPSEPPFDTGF